MNRANSGHRLKCALAVFAVFLIILLFIRFLPDVISLAKSPQALGDYLASFGYAGFLVFILLEIIQVVIAIIPGDLFHIAAGFIFKMPLGFFLAYIGEMMGAILAFGLARYLGSGFIKKLVSRERVEKLSILLNSTKGVFGILVLCLIPGIPKDVLIYAAGITPIKPSRFLAVFLLCRIPDIFIKASGGAAFIERNYTGLTVVIAAFAVFIAVGLLLKKKFLSNETQK